MKQTEKARFGYILSIVLAGTIGVFVRGITLPSGVIAMSRGFLGCVQLFVTPWTAAFPVQASLSFTSPEVCSNSYP